MPTPPTQEDGFEAVHEQGAQNVMATVHILAMGSTKLSRIFK
jgi:hypothetical protein